MRFFGNVFVYVACASAQSIDRNIISRYIPSELLEFTEYFHADLIDGFIAGTPLPTDISSLIKEAPAVPTEMIPEISSKYSKLLSIFYIYSVTTGVENEELLNKENGHGDEADAESNSKGESLSQRFVAALLSWWL